jgi:hypothetical protein
MIRESGYDGMLVRTTNEWRKDLWRVIVAHFSSAYSPSKGPFKVSWPYTLKPPTISWPTFQLAHLWPRLHYTICGSDWWILFSIFLCRTPPLFCETYQFPYLVYIIPENGGSGLIHKFLLKFMPDLKLWMPWLWISWCSGVWPHRSTSVVICVVRLLLVLFCVLFVCKCVQPLGDNPVAVNKYVISLYQYGGVLTLQRNLIPPSSK